MMGEGICLDCNELCLHRQIGSNNDASFCFCAALRAVHFETAHDVSKEFGNVNSVFDGPDPIKYPNISDVDLNGILYTQVQVPTHAHTERLAEYTTVMDFETPFHLPSQDIGQGTGLMPEKDHPVQPSRRRDYTKEEKEEFGR
ncbi:hypothetical protein HYALB_00010798 [Hymenoscyphus albidus]|uniref:Uncharacterized protein n=1 Tax=Hymenoscyphus albidus TaxID=595503 RepID=A0A9N9LQ47_9HELO|nr:hypothetical protein HYALB_00010798 [Hymenoscyphus albidus]